MPRHSRRSLLLATLLAMCLVAGAWAAEVPRLDGPVTDRTGVLADASGEIATALDGLLAQHDVQLFVVFVRTTDELTVTEFADEAARVNSLGGNDALLLVALDDRTDAIWVADALTRITNGEIDAILADDLEPGLRDGDYAGAVLAAVSGLGEAAIPAGPGPTPSASPSATPATGGSSVALLVGVIAVVVGGALLASWVVAWRAQVRDAAERDRRTGKLAREANARLIAMDERVRAAVEEAGFVEAQYGDSRAEPFRGAIKAARDELGAAFAVRQRLDDDEPEDATTREALLDEILQRLDRAGAALDAQAARIRELQELEKTAPAALAALPAQADALEARLPKAEAAIQRLSKYAESAWASVRGNVEEARKGLAGARAAIAKGNAALDGGQPARAAEAIQLAREGIAGGTILLDGVERLAATAADLEGRITAELQAAEEDMTAAKQATAELAAGTGFDAAGGAPSGSTIAAAEERLRAAQAAAKAHPLDPIAAHHLAAEAQASMGEALAAVRRDVAAEARVAATADAALTAAGDAVSRARDYLDSRRSGVGSLARTRLAEAERLLASARAARATDPRSAYEQAGRAHRLAGEAYAIAGQDFERWDRGGPRPGAGGSELAGAILGGIIGGVLAGGGRRGGWGGTPWGSRGPSGGGGGWGGGRSRGGGFGGGGGGGGRSRGGRW